MITVTLEPTVRLDRESLRDAVRRVEFTPTDMRAWVTGTLEPWQPSGDVAADTRAELDAVSVALVDGDTGQRFLLVPGSVDVDLDPSRPDGLTIWGIVETISGLSDVVLRLEGAERAP